MRQIILLILVTTSAFLISSKCEKECQEKIIADCACTKEYAPVCGCNNITYGNACMAECSSINEYTTGPCCKETIKPDCICTLEYDPVCGCNGKTYGNACAAACASITDFQAGECPK